MILLVQKFIAEEMGCIVTDGYGNSLDEKPLLGSSHQFQVSCIVSANKKLHEKIVTEINKGIKKLKKELVNLALKELVDRRKRKAILKFEGKNPSLY